MTRFIIRKYTVYHRVLTRDIIRSFSVYHPEIHGVSSGPITHRVLKLLKFMPIKGL